MARIVARQSVPTVTLTSVAANGSPIVAEMRPLKADWSAERDSGPHDERDRRGEELAGRLAYLGQDHRADGHARRADPARRDGPSPAGRDPEPVDHQATAHLAGEERDREDSHAQVLHRHHAGHHDDDTAQPRRERPARHRPGSDVRHPLTRRTPARGTMSATSKATQKLTNAATSELPTRVPSCELISGWTAPHSPAPIAMALAVMASRPWSSPVSGSRSDGRPVTVPTLPMSRSLTIRRTCEMLTTAPSCA